ncbi:MAG: gamma-glutamyl-gamma-aminobutyrate hydrolase family protein [Clostridia bacterium]|nr:gamma-glutamyl-gamma-aminobutyrate hydrolase family protein [Clostridia bacterium]
MRPVIGLIPLVDEGRESLWMLPGYMDGIRQAGGVPVMLPLTDDAEELRRLAEVCDGFVLTGGHDVGTELYGEEPVGDVVQPCPARDAMERPLLEAALRGNKPVLGICRGLQFINAALGGTLWQDLPTQCPSDVVHRQQPPYDAPSHKVRLKEGSPLRELLGTDEIGVNSCHHQAIRELAPGLEPMAVAPDGLIEAFCKPDHRFLWAVQWHPEFSYKVDPVSRKIFKAFVKSMC